MTKIAIFGVTGYTGHYVATEALKRGLEVVGLGRSVPKEPIEGVEYVAGDAFDQADRAKILEGADAVLLTLAPRPGDEDPGSFTQPLPMRFPRVPVWSSPAVGAPCSAPMAPARCTPGRAPDGRLTAYKQLAGIADDLEARTDNVQWQVHHPAQCLRWRSAPAAHRERVPPGWRNPAAAARGRRPHLDLRRELRSGHRRSAHLAGAHSRGRQRRRLATPPGAPLTRAGLPARRATHPGC